MGASGTEMQSLCLEKNHLTWPFISSSTNDVSQPPQLIWSVKVGSECSGLLVCQRGEARLEVGLWWAPAPSRAPSPNWRRTVAGYGPRGPGHLQGCTLWWLVWPLPWQKLPVADVGWSKVE